MPSAETRYSRVSSGRGAGIEVTSPSASKVAVVAGTLEGLLGVRFTVQFMCGQVPEKTRKVSSGLRRIQSVFSTGPVSQVPCSVTVTMRFLEFPDGKFGDRAQFDGLVGRCFPPHQVVDDADGSAATDDQAAENFEGLAAVLFSILVVPTPQDHRTGMKILCLLRIEGISNPLSSDPSLTGSRRKTYHFSTNQKEVQTLMADRSKTRRKMAFLHDGRSANAEDLLPVLPGNLQTFGSRSKNQGTDRDRCIPGQPLQGMP